MNQEKEPTVDLKQQKLFAIGDKFLALISQSHATQRAIGRETGVYTFRSKEAGNLFAAMRVPSDCESPLTSFIFWQLLRDDNNVGVG